MLFSFNKIDHFQLAAPKGAEDNAREFYSGILGFHEIEKPDSLKKSGGVWFFNGGIQIHIGIETLFTPAKKAHPALEVSNLALLKTHLNNHSVDYLEDDNLPGAERIYIHDPFGNRIELLEWN